MKGFYRHLPAILSVCAGLFLFCGTAVAQNTEDSYEEYVRRMNAKFEARKQHNEKVFNSYRDKINAEFASYMEKAWKKIRMSDSIVFPKRPEPKPVMAPRVETVLPPTHFNLPHVLLAPMEQTAPAPVPMEPIKVETVEPEQVLPELPAEDFIIPENSVTVEKKQPVLLERSEDREMYVRGKNEYFGFKFYGNTCRVRFPKVREYYLQSSAEKAIAEGWKHLSNENYNDAVVDCVCIRHSLHLCDWAVFKLTQAISASYLGDSTSNEAVLMQMYIMTQIGFKIRIARQGEQLVPLVAYAEELYGQPYVEIDGTKFYNMGTASAGELMICDYVFPGEQPSSIRMKELPVTPKSLVAGHRVTSAKYPAMTAAVASDPELIRFCNDYPACDYSILASVPLSVSAKEQLYPVLKKAIAGKGEKVAADMLLDFVQTGFGYQTDEEQFGREKTFFADEMFYYENSDCEDRAILYSILVKDLLGLDVVLLDYPAHVAAAVCFSAEVQGDYFDIEGKKYTICDPTYIGASCGQAMPALKNVQARISRIN